MFLFNLKIMVIKISVITHLVSRREKRLFECECR